MRLRHLPTVPNGVIWSILAAGGVPDAWRTYLGESLAVPAAAG